MNDHLITAVQESVSDVHMDIPAEQIVRRSRTIRARRRLPVLAGALAVVAGAALAVTTLPGAQHPGPAATTQLAAWTVAKQSGGNIRVTIRELRDPAGLQHTLRADGVPASVHFINQTNPACHPYQGAGGSQGQRRHLLKRVYTPFRGHDQAAVVVIHPAGLPPGAGVLIGAGVHHNGASRADITMDLGLVQASQGCTGS